MDYTLWKQTDIIHISEVLAMVKSLINTKRYALRSEPKINIFMWDVDTCRYKIFLDTVCFVTSVESGFGLVNVGSWLLPLVVVTSRTWRQ
jgi:hypothetical protein